jgi:hypothetical protein
MAQMVVQFQIRPDENQTKADRGDQQHMAGIKPDAGGKCAKRPAIMVVTGTPVISRRVSSSAFANMLLPRPRKR